MTTTILFGNGVGMALDATYFTLKTGVEKIINNCSGDKLKVLTLGSGQMPKEERELENHHRILNACEELMKLNNDKIDTRVPSKLSPFHHDTTTCSGQTNQSNTTYCGQT